ncbi:MAG: YbaK/EbsC family protein [Desulfurococcaceae archaeon]
MKTKREIVDGVEVEVLEFKDTVESVEKASNLSGEPPSSIVKTIVLKTGNRYIIALVRGDRRIDLGKAWKMLGGYVELAKPTEVLSNTGLEPGAVTPVSPTIKGFRVIADPLIMEKKYVLCGGGNVRRLYRVKTVDLVNYLKPEFIEIFK